MPLMCPQCKAPEEGTETLRISAIVALTVHIDGTAADECDHEYEAGSYAWCSCGWDGTVGQLLGDWD